MKMLKILSSFLLICFILTSCSSYDQFEQLVEESEIPSQTYSANFNQTWQAVLEIMQQYDIATKNQEAGVIKTRWINNTNQINFSDAFGSREMVKAAQFKLVINLIKGYRGKKEVSKVSIYRRQMVEKDFLQGWRVVRSDGILEKTVLYRIDRILKRENMIKKIEDERAREEEKELF